MLYGNFKYEHTNDLLDLFEKSPMQYYNILNENVKLGYVDEVYEHLNDYEHIQNKYNGNGPLHCLCMIMSEEKQNTIKNNSFGIKTECTLELGLEILHFMVKYGVNLYHRDYYNDTALDFVNDSYKKKANWKLNTEFVSVIRNIYNHFHIDEYPISFNTINGEIRLKYGDRFYEIYKLDNITTNTRDKIIDKLISLNISFKDDIYKFIKIINTMELEYKNVDKIINPII